MNLLTFCSFNSTGIRRPASQDFIKKLLLDYHVDIMLLQETWLLDSQLHVLSDLSSDYMHTGKSGVDSDTGILYGRPKGGTAILWHKNLSDKVVPVETNHRRFTAIELSLIQTACCMLLSSF